MMHVIRVKTDLEISEQEGAHKAVFSREGGRVFRVRVTYSLATFPCLAPKPTL